MELINTVADLFGSVGMLFFLLAEVTQLRKILKLKTVVGISWTTYKNKVIALVSTLIGFMLAQLWLSFGVLFGELIIVIYIMKLMEQYR